MSISPARLAATTTYWGPETEAASYVVGVYQDLFGRDPDPAGYASWQVGIMNGLPRASVANAITASTEYRSHLIADAYLRFLGREPDAGGLQTWLGAMAAGWTIEQIQSGFIASDEYYAQAGSAPAGWVAQLYTDVLDRTAASSEVDGWVTALRRGGARSQVAMGFLLSTENLTTVVDGYYVDLLGRHLDPSGRTTWVTLIQRGTRDEAIIGGIIASDEYWQTTAKAARIELSPNLTTIPVGTDQTYQAMAYDTAGTFIRDITYRTTFSVDASAAACDGAVCTVPAVGEHAVVGVSGAASGTAALRVVPAVHHLALSPPTATTASGASVHYAVEGFAADGRSLGDVTFAATLTVDAAPQACAGAVCSPVALGTRTVTASVLGATGTATVQVAAPGPAGDKAFTWGTFTNDHYGLGLVDAQSFTQLEADTHWAQIDSGNDYFAALKTDGTLWTWGKEVIWGVLGSGDRTPRTVPTQVGTDRDWVQLSAGDVGVAAIKADGTLWTWGGDAGNVPRRVVGPGGTWASVAADGGHWLAVHTDGSLWAWGWGARGELGIGLAGNVSYPVRVGTDHDWVTVAAAFTHSFGIRADGSLWAWGFNNSGQLGVGGREDAVTPVRVGTGTWRSVYAGDFSTAAVATDGSLWAWGSNQNGQLGDGTVDGRDVPTLIAPAGGADWVSVDVGYAWGFGTRSDGTLWSWGRGAQTPWEPVPPTRLQPQRIGTGTGWTDVTAGGGSTWKSMGAALGS